MRAKGKAKQKTVFICRECGHHASSWLGRCPACNSWNSHVEEVETLRASAPPAAAPELTGLRDVDATEQARRICTASAELDRVLGGGLVCGSVVLLGGDPGIGKSTLALQLAAGVASQAAVLYVAGEEAPAQIRLRAERVGVTGERILVLSATDTEGIAAAMKVARPVVAVVDSVQTVHSSRLDSPPGSVSQLREASAELIVAARAYGVALLLIGHVTKEGFLAGPRVLEHMVDTVLYFEGDKNHVFRVLRAVKNRYGPTGEIAVFEMLASGLREVVNPSEAFTGARRKEAAGAVVTACMEGSRSMLVEVQALVTPSNPASARRTTLGIDHARVAMLAAVMEKHLGLTMISQDLFVNTVGGMRVDDPGTDLAILAALASSYVDRALPCDAIIFGEVGLTGEVRAVSQARSRLREAARLGFRQALIPRASLARAEPPASITVEGVATVGQAWQWLSQVSRATQTSA